MDENIVFDPSAKQNQQNPQNAGLEQPGAPDPSQNVGIIQDPQNTVSGNEAEQPATPIVPPEQSVDPSSEVSSADATAQTEVEADSQLPAGDPPPVRNGIFGGKLKKIIIGIVILIFLVFIIFLIYPKGDGNKKAKLVWWGLWEDQEVMQPLISDFQKEHPNITVEYVKQDPNQYRDKLLTRIKNGTGPDIFRFHNTWVPMLSDVLLPFSSDVITGAEFKKNYYPVMQSDLIRNGAIYGIPLGADSLSLFINTDIFKAGGKQSPQTWDDFVKTAGDLTVKDESGKIKTAGAAMGTYGNITHAPDIISLLFVQQGVDLKKFPKEVEKETEALNFYTQFAKGDKSVWDSTLDESLLSFSRGNLAMYIGFSWDILKIQSINKDLPFSVHPVPQLVGRNANIASYWVEGISSKSQNQKASLLFMQYLSKKETAQKFYSTVSKTRPFGEPYARVDLADSLKDNKLIYPFVSQLGIAYSSVFASDTNDGDGGINFLSNNYLGNAINSIINDNSSAQSVSETLGKGVGQVFQKYGIQ